MASGLKRKASKSKATEAAAAAAVMAAAARGLPRGSSAAPAPTRTAATAAVAAASRGLPHSSAPAPTHTRGGVEGTSVRRGSGSAPARNHSGHINGVAAAASIHPQSLPVDIDSSPINGRRGYPVGPGYSHGALASSMGGFGVVGSSQGRCGSPISPQFGNHSSWDMPWDNNSHPPGGFTSLMNSQPHLSQNSHLVGGPCHYASFKAPRPADVGSRFASMEPPQPNGGSSSQEVEVLSDQQAIEVDSDIENVRTERRIMWTPKEDFKLMSAWLKNSTDSSIGADRNNEHYWADVVKSYNKTIPPQEAMVTYLLLDNRET